ncbi:unnamed protein product [Rotaria magnacalcarata]
MSDQELLSHYYRYKLNRFGNFACPLYKDELLDNQQECMFDIEIQMNSLVEINSNNSGIMFDLFIRRNTIILFYFVVHNYSSIRRRPQ